jgi:hypothetical protein
MVSFSDAAQELKGAGIDLEAERAEAVRAHVRWGLVDWLEAAGVVSSADDYGALFNDAKITAHGIKLMKAMNQDGVNFKPIFHANKVGFEVMADFLFQGGEKDVSSFSKNLGAVKEISPYVLIQHWLGTDRRDLNKSYEYAYSKGKKWEEGVPMIEFTGDANEAYTGESPVKSVERMVRSQVRLTDPGAHLVRARHALDAYIDYRATEMGGSLDEMNRRVYERYMKKIREMRSSDEMSKFLRRKDNNAHARLSTAIFPLHANRGGILEYQIFCKGEEVYYHPYVSSVLAQNAHLGDDTIHLVIR